jgi:molybdopterin molybdotransferase
MMRGEGWHGARSRAFDAGRTLAVRHETVGLVAAAGRVLAEPVVAKAPIPGFDTAAMDGYAVRGEQPWRLVGRTLAGDPVPGLLGEGEAREIATGAPTPPNADSVVPYERATVRESAVTAVAHGENVRRAGEEAAAGDELVAAGRVISPPVVSLAAAAGYDELCVRAVPRLAALVTGDELLRSGVPGPGRIRDAIGPALPGWAAFSGAALVSTASVADAAGGLLTAVESAEADMVLVTGSSSVGQADHLDKCMHDIGAAPVVRSVECVPGRTQSLWALPDGRVLVGMPGNPLAALVAYLTLVDPACAGLLGLALPALAPVSACEAVAHRDRVRLVPVTVVDGVARECDYSRSAMLRGAALADAIAVVPPGFVSGGPAELIWLPGSRR